MSSKERPSFFRRAQNVLGVGKRARAARQAAQAARAAQAAQAVEEAQAAQAALEAQSAHAAQVAQGAIKRTGVQGPSVEQGAIRRTGALAAQVAQGAIRRTGAQGSPVEQGAIRRTGALAAQIEQGAIRRTGAYGSPVEQGAIRRTGALAAQIEQGAIRRTAFQGAQRPLGAPPIGSPVAQERQGSPGAQGAEGFIRPLSRFGRFSPAGCWSTHRGLESWARLAKEKHRSPSNPETESTSEVRELRISREQRTVQPASTMVPHGVNPDYPKPVELIHQARSYSGRTYAHLNRTPSISSQGSSDSSSAKQGSDHRGSSPQIRTYSPDGRGLLDTASGFTLRTSSPFRAASLDMRWECRTQSSSQGSLSSSSSHVPGSPRIPPCLRLVSADSHGPPSSPLGGIQPDLYTQRNTPLFLPLSGAGPSLGRLHLRLKYDFDRSDLNVHVIEVHNLPVGENGGFNDPYVRLEMVPPVDAKKRETGIVRNNVNPYYDEHFKFPISHEDLQDRTLIFQIYDFDRFSRNDIIGEIKMEMSEIELVSSIEIWAELARTKKPREEYQELLVSLSYLPSAQRLTIVVLKGRNLYVNPAKGTVDPFVKIYLLAEGKRTKKRRTQTKKGNRNPVWNEAFTFNVTSKTLSKSAMEICVFDQTSDLMSVNPMIGCCLLGGGEEGLERDHWIEVTQSPRKTVAMWHTLR